MTRYLYVTVTVVAVIAAGAVFFATGDVLVPLALCSVAVAAWAFAPSSLGRANGLGELDGKIDPAEVKEYRRRHPGVSISDAARSVAEGRS